MRKKKLSPKDTKLKKWLKDGGRKGAKKDLLTLLKRASTTSPR